MPVGLRLADSYPAAYKDFYGLPCFPPCVYKSGPAWRENTDVEGYRICRQPRPVYDHPIADQWRAIGTSIYKLLDLRGVKWTSIDPVAYAEAKKVVPFCPLLIWIGVQPESLLYDDAVAAAAAIKEILDQAGFPEIEVAFRESVVARSVASGPKLLPFKSDFDPESESRKPFTPALGLSIAPLQTPQQEGTGALYLRIGDADKKHTVLLTAAHVVRPLPGLTTSPERDSQHAEEIILLGDKGYSDALTNIQHAIDVRALKIGWCNGDLVELSKPAAEGEDEGQREADRMATLRYINSAEIDIRRIDMLQKDVTRDHWTDPQQRTIGFVLHAEPIAVGDAPHQFTRDWALIELYEEKIAWDSFKGNKVYVGGNLSMIDYMSIMYPTWPMDQQVSRCYPRNGLLQASGIVKDEEIRSPRHVDANGYKCLTVVKNGLATGSTLGRVNGLESFIRIYSEDGSEQTSVEVAVLPLSKKGSFSDPFSDPGDSGAIVLERGGAIVGMITAGGGKDDCIHVTYLTPFWWLEEQIKKVFPDAYLYEVVK